MRLYIPLKFLYMNVSKHPKHKSKQELNSVECLGKAGKIKTHQRNAIRIKTGKKIGLSIQFINFVGTRREKICQ